MIPDQYLIFYRRAFGSVTRNVGWAFGRGQRRDHGRPSRPNFLFFSLFLFFRRQYSKGVSSRAHSRRSVFCWETDGKKTEFLLVMAWWKYFFSKEYLTLKKAITEEGYNIRLSREWTRMSRRTSETRDLMHSSKQSHMKSKALGKDPWLSSSKVYRAKNKKIKNSSPWIWILSVVWGRLIWIRNA